MFLPIAALACAFLISVIATPIVRRVVLQLGWVDAAGRTHRKVHARDIPRLGGVAIVLAFLASVIGAIALSHAIDASDLFGNARLAIGFLAGATTIALLGVYDDINGSSATIKLTFQSLAAITVIACGFLIERIDLPLLPGFELGLFAYPVSLLWIVGVTNAVNLIDGLDGLAAGISLIGVMPVAAVALATGQMPLALVALALSGALLGFLVHNFHPAKIFMGDTGSMFLGFTLAVITAHTAQKVSVVASLTAPVIALALPILDTLLAMTRRAAAGRPVFSPDREHIHHRLLRRGLSHRGVVLTMYGLAASFACCATLLLLYRGLSSGIALLVTVVLAAFTLRALGYFKNDRDLVSVIEATLTARRKNIELYRRLASFSKACRLFSNDTLLGKQVIDLACCAGAAGVVVQVPSLAIDMVFGTTSVHEKRHFVLSDENGVVVGNIGCFWPDGVLNAVALHVMETVRDRLELRLREQIRSSATPAKKVA